MKASWGVIAGLALMVSACTTTGGSGTAEGRLGFAPALPPMPSMPSLPTIRISDVRVPGFGRGAPEPDPSLEPVVHWRVIEEEILVVHTGGRGCTARADFTVHVEPWRSDLYTVRLERSRPDTCGQDLPWGVQLGFSFGELGVPAGSRIVVLNPLDETLPEPRGSGGVQVAVRR